MRSPTPGAECVSQPAQQNDALPRMRLAATGGFKLDTVMVIKLFHSRVSGLIEC